MTDNNLPQLSKQIVTIINNLYQFYDRNDVNMAMVGILLSRLEKMYGKEMTIRILNELLAQIGFFDKKEHRLEISTPTAGSA